MTGNKIPFPAVPPRARPAASSAVLKKLAPDAPGAKRLASRFGDALLCVRIAYDETEPRRLVKAAGGQWDAEHKLWRLPKSAVRKLKLEQRVVNEKA